MLSYSPPLPYVNYFDTSFVATFIFDISSSSRRLHMLLVYISYHSTDATGFVQQTGWKSSPPSPFTSMRAFVRINSLRKVLRQQGLANLVHGTFVIVISISVTVIFWSIMKGSRFHSRDSISYKCQKAAASGGPAACALPVIAAVVAKERVGCRYLYDQFFDVSRGIFRFFRFCHSRALACHPFHKNSHL